MDKLIQKIIRSNRISEEETEQIENQLEYLKQGLLNPESIDALKLLPSISRILLYGLNNEKNKLEVLDMLAWFKNSDTPFLLSPAIKTLLDALFIDFQGKRIGTMLSKISEQKSLTDVSSAQDLVASMSQENLTRLYENKVPELNIDFEVFLIPFASEVLEPRLVVIKPGMANEMHRHAHETVFLFLKGKGKVIVDKYENEVNSGDFSFIPRWCVHQTVNIGEEDLVFLAIADFGLTGKSFMGNYTKTARLKKN